MTTREYLNIYISFNSLLVMSRSHQEDEYIRNRLSSLLFEARN